MRLKSYRILPANDRLQASAVVGMATVLLIFAIIAAAIVQMVPR